MSIFNLVGAVRVIERVESAARESSSTRFIQKDDHTVRILYSEITTQRESPTFRGTRGECITHRATRRSHNNRTVLQENGIKPAGRCHLALCGRRLSDDTSRERFDQTATDIIN